MTPALCNDSEIEIEVEDGVVCEICGLELEGFYQVTGAGIHGYYYWTCVRGLKIALGGVFVTRKSISR